MTNQDQILQYLTDCLEGTDCFLVEFKLKPTNNFKIFLDADTGLQLEKCIQINRCLRRKIEESGLYPEGDFSIEVSSPGVDAPLRLPRQYAQHIGRKLEIVLQDDESPALIARLQEIIEHGIRIELLPLKRTPKKTALPAEIRELRFEEIKSATVCIEF